MKHAHQLAALVAAAALTLSACGGENAPAGTDIPASAEFNDADVAFATGMIPHHAQALVMVDLTRGRELTPEFEQLTEQILAAQAPEIELMADWLDEWGQPVPETSRDHLNAEGHGTGGMAGSEMPGMASDEELADLGDRRGRGFEEMWLLMMIAHHQGAIEMARAEQQEGEDAASIDLANAIDEGQQAEIAQMETMLAD